MQYDKSLKGQTPSCQGMLQGKEVFMGDKSDHMIAADDKNLFFKRKQPNRTKPLPREKEKGVRGKPTSKPKTSFFSLVEGQMESLDVMKHYSWKLNGSSIPPAPNM